MSFALTTIFGNEIKVRPEPRQPDRQITGYAGAHGATSMLLGSTGYRIIVTGTLRTSGANYALARRAMVLWLEAIEAFAWAPEQIYTYGNEAYWYAVYEKLTLLDSNGKSFHYTAEGYCVTRFICTFRCLL